MSHTFKTKAGNKKLKGKDAEQKALENRQNRKKERSLREARRNKHV